jgi:xylulokinase
MQGEVILAHDMGTTGNKASLYNLEGKLLQSCYHSYDTHYPRPTWVEQAPDDWWKAFIRSTKEVLATSRVNPSRVLGLSFSGQMMAGIPVDREGNVLQETTMIWADHRSQSQADFIKKNVGWEKFYRATGSGMEIPLYPIAKILWLKENEPEIYKKIYKFLGVKDLLILRLTGRFVTDYSDASNTGLLDIQRKSWASDILTPLGIDEDKLCDQVLPSTTIVGKVGKEVCKETGLREGTPIILGGGDVASAALGAGVIKEGSAYNYIGSASWLAVASSRPLFDEKMRPFTLCHVVPDMYVVQLAMFSAGVVYEWVRDQICRMESSNAKDHSKDPFDLMNQEAACSPPGANGLLFLPNLRPGGAPHNDLNDHGALLGLALAHKREDILRAVLEGITFNIRLMCEAMEKQIGVPFKELRLIGGGSKSTLWREIEANILNKPIVTLSAQQEANSMGAAITAGVALGVFESFEKATERYIKTRETTKPDESTQEVYQRQFPVFTQAYYSLVSVNNDLSRLARGYRGE